jgi:hypothetical protein
VLIQDDGEIKSGTFYMKNVTGRMLAYRIRAVQVQRNIPSYKMTNAAAVLNPGCSVEVRVFMLAEATYQDKIQISLFHGNQLKLGGLSQSSESELRKVLKSQKANSVIQLSLTEGEDTVVQQETKEQEGEGEGEEQEPEGEVNTEPDKIFYACGVCNRIFKYLGKLKTHSNTAHGTEDPQFKCPVQNCKYMCATQKRLNQHYKRKHTMKDARRCPECDKTLPSEKTLQIHQAVHHVPTKCNVCGVVEPSRLLARQHMKNKHSRLKQRPQEIAPPPCEVCGRPFKTRNGLRKHLKTHAGVNVVAAVEEVVVGGGGEQQDAGAVGHM